MKGKYILILFGFLNLSFFIIYLNNWVELKKGIFYPEGYGYLFKYFLLYTFLAVLFIGTLFQDYWKYKLLVGIGLLLQVLVVNGKGRSVPLSGIVVSLLMLILVIIAFKVLAKSNSSN